MIGFVVSAVGTFIMGGSFNLNTQIIDIIPGTVVFGIGVGFLLSQLTNLTMSAAREESRDRCIWFPKCIQKSWLFNGNCINRCSTVS